MSNQPAGRQLSAHDTTDLRPRRVALGLTQEELAHEADCAVSTLRLWEKAQPGPARGSRNLRRIRRTLDRLETERADVAA